MLLSIAVSFFSFFFRFLRFFCFFLQASLAIFPDIRSRYGHSHRTVDFTLSTRAAYLLLVKIHFLFHWLFFIDSTRIFMIIWKGAVPHSVSHLLCISGATVFSCTFTRGPSSIASFVFNFWNLWPNIQSWTIIGGRSSADVPLAHFTSHRVYLSTAQVGRN